MWRQREKKDRHLDCRRQLADGLGSQRRHEGEAREQLQAQAPGLAQDWAPEVGQADKSTQPRVLRSWIPATRALPLSCEVGTALTSNGDRHFRDGENEGSHRAS